MPTGQFLSMTINDQSFEQLQRQVKLILEAETDDFFELAKLAGLNPLTDFVMANLSGLNLQSAQLSRANLLGANLAYSNLV
ncbi:MAG: pentapeptide repeat-containing protein, partial [Leptolyngbyaceae cyanobacterium]